MDLHLDIQSNTAPHIKHKAQLNYAEFTAIIFIKWQHSSGQAIQMLLHTYISHCSLILCGTAPLAFGHSCWKSCEMILKKMWKTSPDRHWDGAVTGDRQLVRQKQSCHPVQPAMIIPLFWQEDWLLLSTCSDKTNMCQTHPCVFCSSATEWETFSLHHSLSKPPVAAESLLSPWEHIQDCFCPSLRTSQIRWSCSSWGHPAQLRTLSTTEAALWKGRLLLLSGAGLSAELLCLEPCAGVCRETGIQQHCPHGTSFRQIEPVHC